VLAQENVTLNGIPLQSDVLLALGDLLGTPEGTFTAIRLEP
jgi:hypothetical protein